MAYYRTCPLCGASLDPGELCDCVQEREKIEQKLDELYVIGEHDQLRIRFMEGIGSEKLVV